MKILRVKERKGGYVDVTIELEKEEHRLLLQSAFYDFLVFLCEKEQGKIEKDRGDK